MIVHQVFINIFSFENAVINTSSVVSNNFTVMKGEHALTFVHENLNNLIHILV